MLAIAYLKEKDSLCHLRRMRIQLQKVLEGAGSQGRSLDSCDKAKDPTPNVEQLMVKTSKLGLKK